MFFSSFFRSPRSRTSQSFWAASNFQQRVERNANMYLDSYIFWCSSFFAVIITSIVSLIRFSVSFLEAAARTKIWPQKKNNWSLERWGKNYLGKFFFLLNCSSLFFFFSYYLFFKIASKPPFYNSWGRILNVVLFFFMRALFLLICSFKVKKKYSM